MHHAEVSPQSCSLQDTENIILKDRIAILEERLQAYEVAYHTPPVFPEILSPYFRKLITSRVIYRDPSHWGSSCWVDVGREHNIQKLLSTFWEGSYRSCRLRGRKAVPHTFDY